MCREERLSGQEPKGAAVSGAYARDDTTLLKKGPALAFEFDR
jgi:hypothetical protein